MSVITILLTLLVATAVIWFVNTYFPMGGKPRTALTLIIVSAVTSWLIFIAIFLGLSG